ncbi:MAG TPA: MaoC/PaaZ C-terminal domain-containing protein [Anaerolineales bacterium]|nr:MaoC/PaaZ C-terminal domain-containing protein [Anaerolineales bacterium]
MSNPIVTNRAMHFEDFAVGQTLQSRSRTITETDIVNFAGLSGDFNSIHTDAAYAATTPFQQRIAHGLLGASIASGLAVQTGIMDGTIMAFREISEWRFRLPIVIGDTITVHMEITETKAMPRLGGGAVTIEMRVMNQKSECVQQGKWVVLMKGR